MWDRAIQSACYRQVQQLHKASELEGTGFDELLPTALMGKLNWVTSSACCNHDAHNGLKWSVMEFSSDPKVMRGLFICIESLRNGFSLLMQNLKPWLQEVLQYEDAAGFPHHALWALLGLDPNMAEIAEDLQLRFHGGQLKVASKWAIDPAVWGSIELVLLHIWSFRKYSDSRWLSLGPSCRGLMAAQVTGIFAYVQWVLARPGNSRYYLGGFVDYYSAPVARLAVVVATSSFPADAALASMMEDDRLARTIAALEEDMMLEVQYVHTLPAAIWGLLASRSSWDAVALRHAGMSGCLTSASFIMWRLQYLHQLPWTLVQGNIENNLADLASSPQPTEETSGKIWGLLQMNYPRQDIVDAVALMGNASFSSEQVEQGHSFASNLMKRHREYGEESLRCRSLIASVRSLLLQSPVEKLRLRAEQQLERLRRKRPQCFTGRQFYFQQLRCLAGHIAREGRQLAPDVSQQLMRSHGSSWASLSVEQRLSMEAKAATARLQMEADIEANRQKVQAELQLLQRRQEEESSAHHGLPVLRMSSARWGQAECRQLDELFHSSNCVQSKVVELRREVHAEIGQPSQEIRDFLSGLPTVLGLGCSSVPPWLGLVCRRREFFAQCVFRFMEDPAEVVYCRPTFIRKNPFVVGFVQLHKVSGDTRSESVRGESCNAVLSEWNHVFSIDGAFAFTNQGNFGKSWSVSVLTDTFLRPQSVVVSECEWKTLDEIKLLFPDDDPAADEGHADEEAVDEGHAEEESVPAWAQLPWLLEHFPLYGSGAEATKAKATGSEDNAKAESASEEEVEPLLSAQDVFDALYARRFHWATCGDEVQDFKVTLRGGNWTSAHTGKAFNEFRGGAVGGEAGSFCARYRLVKTTTCAINLYTEEGARALCALWCHRMQWYLDLWRASGREDAFIFAEDDLLEYVEPEASAPAGQKEAAAFAQRLASIRAIRPR